jgi:diguanylate cyclase (GGDEF)-like protein
MRYATAVVGFVALAVAGIFTFHATLDRIDEATDQLQAVADQTDRLHLIASDMQVLVDAELNRDQVSPEVETDLARVRVDLGNTISEFRDVQLGLTEGTGTSGLPAPTAAMDRWWHDTDAQRADRLETFYDEATRLTGALGVMTVDPIEVEALNNSVQAAVVPVNGWAATILDEALDEYAAALDTSIQEQRDANQLLMALTAAMALAAVFLLFRPMAQRIQLETTALGEAEREARENNERQLFRNQLVLGLERASSEDEIFDRVQAALHEAIPDRPAELLLADAGRGHLTHVRDHPDAGSPGCPVEEPSDCVAIARSQTVRFETSRALDVCPKLPRHAGAPCSAVCSPVRFLGQPLGVLHLTGPDLAPPDHQLMERINVIADETGSRLGMLRTTRETRLQASTDGLTSLPNRRSLEAAAHEMLAAGRQFAIAIADLDRFKDLNDTHGHEAGDRALRLFARTLRANLRPDDVAARYGGEEFVLLLPATTVVEAQRALDRIRVTLAGDIASAGVVPFTASWGLSSSEVGDGFAEMLQTADEALYAAKRAGRNRLVIARTAGGPTEPDDEDDGDAAGPPELLPCPSCQFPCPAGAKYCLRCGAGLPPRAGPAGDENADGSISDASAPR